MLQPDGSGQCPYSAYAELRSADPIHRTPDGVWIVSQYDAYTTLLRDPRISRHQAALKETGDTAGAREDIKEAVAAFPYMILNQDGEGHMRLRRFLRNVFLPSFVEAWRPRIEAVAKDVVDHALTLDTFDFVQEIGYPIPERIMSDLVGIPDSHRAIWAGWSKAMTRFSRAKGNNAPDVAVVQDAMGKFHDYMKNFIAERKAAGTIDGDDMLSVLVRAREEKDFLTDEELVSNMVALTQAAHETTANLMSNTMSILLQDTALMERVRADLDLLPRVVDETLRTESPSVSVLPRTPLEDIDYDGVIIPKGDRIIFLTAAANRDPARFDRPEEFDIDRENLDRHVGFGAGPHICIGQHLGRLEVVTALREILPRMPNLKLIEKPVFVTGRARHLERLMVRNA
ncbi:MAG: cytochrome P450 [Pseudomonadota bacterium]